MTLDVKLPRWLALTLVLLWALSLGESIVCQAINARANLHYLAGESSSPPPPYPGQPAMSKTEPPAQPKDDGRKKILPLRK